MPACYLGIQCPLGDYIAANHFATGLGHATRHQDLPSGEFMERTSRHSSNKLIKVEDRVSHAANEIQWQSEYWFKSLVMSHSMASRCCRLTSWVCVVATAVQCLKRLWPSPFCTTTARKGPSDDQ